MHIMNDTLVNTAALTVGLHITDTILEAWGQGCVELYFAIGEWAKIVTEEEKHLSQALDAVGASWPGVFAYEVTEAVGGCIRDALVWGEPVDEAKVRQATRQAVCRFCTKHSVEVMDNYMYRSTLLTR